jgi:predicted nucleotidyltransferase
LRSQVLRVTRAVSERLTSEGAEAVFVFGSRVRGDAYEESDIDMHAIGRESSYKLERFQGFLLSISWETARQHRRAFKNPAEVGGIIPAWRNALIVYDPKKIAEKLRQEAKDWQWTSLSKRADAWVAEELTGWAEEVHRLTGNLRLRRRNAAAVQRSVLAIHLAKVLSVHHRIFYDSENQLWDLVSGKMGTEWAKAQGIALSENGERFEDTCDAAFQLYSLAAKEIKHLLNERQLQVVTHACEIAGYPL